MNNDTMKDIINDVRDLASTRKNPMTRLALEGIANRLEKLVADGTHLNKHLKDAPKVDVPPADKPISPNVPEMVSGGDSFRKFLTVKWLGMEFRRFKSNAETLYVATWRNDETKDSHVYEVRVKRDGDSPNCGWIAQATNDGGRVFSLSAKNRSYCELCALSAMKRYLSCGHRGPYRKRRAEAAKKEVAA